MTERNNAQTSGKKTEFILTGRHVVFIIIGIFAVVGGVNAYMVMQSVKTFRGEDVKQSYRQGLKYNKTLQTRSEQTASGWHAELTVNGHTLILSLLDSTNVAVRGLTLTGLLKHPIETDFDIPLTFTGQADGTYIAHIEKNILGKRILTTSAVREDGFTFETKNELWLK